MVADLLPYLEVLTGDEEYALHEMISEMQPDSALLAIAMSAAKIANANRNFSPAFRFLSVECARIAEEYGPLWMRNAVGGRMYPLTLAGLDRAMRELMR